MSTELVNGIKIRYDVRGDGPPVLLSHGYSATGRMWDGQLAAFSDRYRMIAWDMRGHGQTDSRTIPRGIRPTTRSQT